MAAMRSATASVSICSSGVSAGTAAACSTSSWVTVFKPVIAVTRADMMGVKYSSSPTPTTITLIKCRPHQCLETPNQSAGRRFRLIG